MLSPLMTGRCDTYSFATVEIPLAGIRAAARGFSASVNDVFLTGLTGGMARYHDRHERPAVRLRFTVPISLRDRLAGSSAGNAVTLATLELPVNGAPPAVRLTAARQGVRRWRAEPALHVGHRLVNLHWLVPVPRLLAGARRNDVSASNVPGPTGAVSLAGVPVTGIWPLVSPVGTAVNATMISYADRACLGIVADDAAVPDIAALAADLQEGMLEVTADR